MTNPRLSNKEPVRQAFHAWAATSGSVFDILDEGTGWVIAGSAPSDRTSGGGRGRAAAARLTAARKPNARSRA